MTTTDTAANIAANIAAIFASDERIVRVTVRHDGYVPNSYRWRAPGSQTTYTRDGTATDGTYDRKRSGGRGPAVIGYSAKGGTLYSR